MGMRADDYQAFLLTSPSCTVLYVALSNGVCYNLRCFVLVFLDWDMGGLRSRVHFYADSFSMVVGSDVVGMGSESSF